MSELSVEHLLGIKYLKPNDIDVIFKTADHFKEVINRPIKKVPSLRDITIANLFFENILVLITPSLPAPFVNDRSSSNRRTTGPTPRCDSRNGSRTCAGGLAARCQASHWRLEICICIPFVGIF